MPHIQSRHLPVQPCIALIHGLRQPRAKLGVYTVGREVHAAVWEDGAPDLALVKFADDVEADLAERERIEAAADVEAGDHDCYAAFCLTLYNIVHIGIGSNITGSGVTIRARQPFTLLPLPYITAHKFA